MNTFLDHAVPTRQGAAGALLGGSAVRRAARLRARERHFAALSRVIPRFLGCEAEAAFPGVHGRRRLAALFSDFEVNSMGLAVVEGPGDQDGFVLHFLPNSVFLTGIVLGRRFLATASTLSEGLAA